MNPLKGNPFNASLAKGVAKVGFRKWYERELLSSHAHMILAFLSVIALLASMEAFRGGTPPEKLMNVAFAVACAGVALWALRRYLFLLMRAEDLANQANCPDCGEYGRFRVVCDRHDDEETEVSCRKCERRWVINGAA